MFRNTTDKIITLFRYCENAQFGFHTLAKLDVITLYQIGNTKLLWKKRDRKVFTIWFQLNLAINHAKLLFACIEEGKNSLHQIKLKQTN